MVHKSNQTNSSIIKSFLPPPVSCRYPFSTYNILSIWQKLWSYGTDQLHMHFNFTVYGTTDLRSEHVISALLHLMVVRKDKLDISFAFLLTESKRKFNL
jgi:hypothetical protein